MKESTANAESPETAISQIVLGPRFLGTSAADDLRSSSIKPRLHVDPLYTACRIFTIPYLHIEPFAMNGGTRRAHEEETKRKGLRCSKRVDYLRRNGVPELLCLLSGRRIAALKQFAFICGFLTTRPLSWLPMRAQIPISQRCFTLASTEGWCSFFSFILDIMSGSVTSRYFFLHEFLLLVNQRLLL